jgi:hypothetical protein
LPLLCLSDAPSTQGLPNAGGPDGGAFLFSCDIGPESRARFNGFSVRDGASANVGLHHLTGPSVRTFETVSGKGISVFASANRAD